MYVYKKIYISYELVTEEQKVTSSIRLFNNIENAKKYLVKQYNKYLNEFKDQIPDEEDKFCQFDYELTSDQRYAGIEFADENENVSIVFDISRMYPLD